MSFLATLGTFQHGFQTSFTRKADYSTGWYIKVAIGLKLSRFNLELKYNYAHWFGTEGLNTEKQRFSSQCMVCAALL